VNVKICANSNEITGKYMLNILVRCEEFCKLYVITTSTKSRLHGLLHYYFLVPYIRGAGWLLHWSQYLSLSTATWYFFAPTFFTSNDNDK
jgi:hypothetical protein